MSMFMCVFLLAFALPFYFPHFLPHSFPFLLHLKFVDYLNLLRTPHKEGMDSSDEFLLTTETTELRVELPVDEKQM